jgi:hypothetical protein
MSIFSSIQSQILGQQAAAAAAASMLEVGAATAASTATGKVDVEQKLEQISQDKGNPKLNWRTSIADLMRLLDLDPSLANRAELAGELGYKGERNGSAEMNIWLYKEVMAELEKSGGVVPETLKG